MAILENLVEGFAGAAGDEGTVSRIEQRKGERKQFSDQERERQRGMFETASHNLQKHIALLLDPNTMQPVKGKEAQVAGLRQEMNRIHEHLQNFSNPDFNPQTGMVTEDPIHKLTDKLKLTHPPAQNKTAADQMQDLKGIQQKYAEEPPPAPLLTPEEQRKGARISAGIEPRAVEPRQQKEQWDLLQGSVSGQPVSWLKNKYDGSVTDLAGNPVPSDQLQNFVATPKTTAKPRKAWGKDANGRFYSVLLDPFTNQKMPNTENYDEQPPASLSGRVTSGFYHFTDSEGNIHQVEETKTSMPAGSAGAPRSGTPKPSANGPSTPRPPGQQINDLRAMHDKSKIGQPKPATGKSGDKILGHKDTPEAVAAKKIADVLDTDARLADYRLTHRSPPGDTGIVMSWVRAQVRGAGRMTNVEIEQGLKSGSYEQRFENAYQRAAEGTLSGDFIRNMVADIKAAAKAARDTADKYKSGASSDSDVDDIVKALKKKG